MKKRAFALLLVTILTLFMAACGDRETPGEPQAPPQSLPSGSAELIGGGRVSVTIEKVEGLTFLFNGSAAQAQPSDEGYLVNVGKVQKENTLTLQANGYLDTSIELDVSAVSETADAVPAMLSEADDGDVLLLSEGTIGADLTVEKSITLLGGQNTVLTGTLT